jgi:hypothetical protein
MSKSAIAKLDDLLAMESHQLHKQKIPKIRAALEALEHGADRFASQKGGNFW